MNQNKIFPFLIALIVLVVALGVVIAQSNQKEKYVPSKTEGTSELVAPITDTKTSTTPTTPITPTPVVSKPTPKPTTPTPTPTKPAVNSYTLAQVAIHNRESDCWTTINGGVYNVTPFIDQHPGGSEAIISLCGIDGSYAFYDQHSGERRPANELALFKIGVLK